MMITE